MSWDSSVLLVEEKTKAVILSKHKEIYFLSGLQNLSELTGEECSVDSLVYKAKEEELPPKYTFIPNLLIIGYLPWHYRQEMLFPHTNPECEGARQAHKGSGQCTEHIPLTCFSVHLSHTARCTGAAKDAT